MSRKTLIDVFGMTGVFVRAKREDVVVNDRELFSSLVLFRNAESMAITSWC